MVLDPPPERRRAPRHLGDGYPLRIGRHSARLVDWSATGVGLQIKEEVDGYRIGDPTTLSIHSELTHGVAVFPAVIRRVDAAERVVGVDFAEDAETAVRFLVATVGDVSEAVPEDRGGEPR